MLSCPLLAIPYTRTGSNIRGLSREHHWFYKMLKTRQILSEIINLLYSTLAGGGYLCWYGFINAFTPPQQMPPFERSKIYADRKFHRQGIILRERLFYQSNPVGRCSYWFRISLCVCVSYCLFSITWPVFKHYIKLLTLKYLYPFFPPVRDISHINRPLSP